MLTAAYSVMHFLVDFICAWAMFGFFLSDEGAYLNILIYNFCAFALQMPLGTLLDLARRRAGERLKNWLAPICAALGTALTVAGALTNPLLLGLGNALFHVGGGLDVTAADFADHRGGKLLGVFVAPGALGLFLGTRLGKAGSGWLTLLLAVAALAASLGFLIFHKRKPSQTEAEFAGKAEKANLPVLILCCFAVVVFRSWTGFEAGFGWKSDVFLGMIAVLAVASGKAAGGFLGSRLGHGKTAMATLLLAAVCFLLGESPVFGLAALFLFNMSMPVTLYLLAKHMPELMGFSFGLLTFGLFLGFLPVYARLKDPLTPPVICAAGSLVSALLMVAAWKAVDRDRVSA